MTTIFLVLICTNKNYTHRADMDTDADEVKHRTVDVGDEEHQESGYNGNDEGNLFGFRYFQVDILDLDFSSHLETGENV